MSATHGERSCCKRSCVNKRCWTSRERRATRAPSAPVPVPASPAPSMCWRVPSRSRPLPAGEEPSGRSSSRPGPPHGSAPSGSSTTSHSAASDPLEPPSDPGPVLAAQNARASRARAAIVVSATRSAAFSPAQPCSEPVSRNRRGSPPDSSSPPALGPLCGAAAAAALCATRIASTASATLGSAAARRLATDRSSSAPASEASGASEASAENGAAASRALRSKMRWSRSATAWAKADRVEGGCHGVAARGLVCRLCCATGDGGSLTDSAEPAQVWLPSVHVVPRVALPGCYGAIGVHLCVVISSRTYSCLFLIKSLRCNRVPSAYTCVQHVLLVATHPSAYNEGI